MTDDDLHYRVREIPGSVSYWKPSLTDEDVRHLRSLGLVGACIQGNPYRSHLKQAGSERALCGAAPGKGRGGIRTPCWLTWRHYERPGCQPCDKCLKAAESLALPSGVPDRVTAADPQRNEGGDHDRA
jgi:hypothetical protein